MIAVGVINNNSNRGIQCLISIKTGSTGTLQDLKHFLLNFYITFYF